MRNTNRSTLAIHLVDSTTLTNPGPVTEQEHESTISDVGRLFKRAYVKKKGKKTIVKRLKATDFKEVIKTPTSPTARGALN